MEPFIGTIVLWAGQSIPNGWEACNGQVLSAGANQALFAVIGFKFGGNPGAAQFQLPSLNKTAPLGTQWIIATTGVMP
ncbi:phage tail protein [Nitrospirillum sp. BR 11828]|uniref:phage tail protein n=1 Tax=Nitrospirillum sp. BR 11828 TaxID=3104325 RepID=UPI002ACA0996|nr:phage tail protein [Nitrospirillum sp. BR 11828]MDZ5648678.1 phage tail protein [Nitrospirillum sp. BR 11828]